jgi:hypothetical protein
MPANVLDAMMAINDALVEWLLYAQPTDEAERSDVERVLSLRTQIEHQLNQLVLVRMKLATMDLSDHAARLGTISKQIRATTKSIETAKNVLNAADQVVSVAASVLAAVA